MKRLNARELAHIIAALRFFGRAAEISLVHPRETPFVKARLRDVSPMTLDEIETLIGRLDDSWTSRGLRTWDASRYL
jgi:hypothetical protein